MGWMASWVAVQASKDAILQALGLNESDERVLPGSRSYDLSCAVLPSGWCVIFAEDFDWASEERVLRLSRLGEAIGCQFEDKVDMTSVAFAARDGVALWRVFHENTSPYRLDVTGTPPKTLDAIKARLFREQEENGGEESSVDFGHDVPLEVAKSICGYRHDDDDRHLVFLRLESLASSKAEAAGRGLSFLQKLLAPLRPRRFDR
jgi:hypothetical protein